MFAHGANALQVVKHLWFDAINLIGVEVERRHSLEQKIGGARISTRQFTQFAGGHTGVRGHAFDCFLPA